MLLFLIKILTLNPAKIFFELLIFVTITHLVFSKKKRLTKLLKLPIVVYLENFHKNKFNLPPKNMATPHVKAVKALYKRSIRFLETWYDHR